jgi:hypothetical protein
LAIFRVESGIAVVQSHNGDDKVAGGRDLLRALQLLGALGDQVLDGTAVAMRQHVERIALGKDVLADAVAHQADADHTNALRFRHVGSLSS